MATQPEPFAALLQRYGEADISAAVTRIHFATALAAGDDPGHVLPYLRRLGFEIAHLNDLLAINADPAEEELAAHPVTEGVAISIASEGTWLLFER